MNPLPHLAKQILAALLAVFPLLASAHIGSPNVIFEGNAGPYPVRVVIRPPGVAPGLAEISIRVRTNGVQSVTVLPVHWKAGEKGAPPPDPAHPVRGDDSLYSSELWLMEVGSYSVYVNVDGAQGRGTAIVPVASIATEPREMPKLLGAALLSLATLLFFGGITLIGAAIRESVLPPGELPSPQRLWGSRAAMLVSALGLAGAIYGGWHWWTTVDEGYRGNRLYQAVQISPSVRSEGAQQILQLNLADDQWNRRDRGPLIPDHGKLMHMFLIREPDLGAFAHLHPIRRDSTTFEVPLPNLPPGTYQIYADVTQESGMPHTLTNSIFIPAPAAAAVPVGEAPFLAPDPDDSFHVTRDSFPTRHDSTYTLPGGSRVTWENPQAEEGTLRFKVTDPNGALLELEPYMGMLSHLVVRKTDGSVFAHVHPSGTISVAAQQVFQLRAQGKSADAITAEALEEFCKDPPVAERRQTLRFPYEFPQPGDYRLWIQIKLNGTIHTAPFDTSVK